MKRQPKRVDTALVIQMYTNQHLTVRQIGALVGYSGAGIAKILKTHGIARSRGEWVIVHCNTCGLVFEKNRSSWRRSLGMHFCSEDCHGKYIENPIYNPSRSGQKVARRVVAAVFPLESKYIVHHHDSDCTNNNLSNLAVFACASDHMAYHHGNKHAKPIWDGRTHEVRASPDRTVRS